MYLKKIFIIIFCLISVKAYTESIPSTNITFLSVNGTDDWTESPGTTCIQVSGQVAEQCPSGVIAIPKNHKLLVSAALTAFTTDKDIWLYYRTNGASNHCPGLAFTQCEVLNIGFRK